MSSSHGLTTQHISYSISLENKVKSKKNYFRYFVFLQAGHN
jgi:hypothetical protein